MDDHSGYLRYPSIRDDAIVFVSDDDLWRVPADGGTARRLTAGLSEPSTPCLSPDGRWIAFVGRDEQHPEVYLMPSDGGPARRLTWLGPDVIVRGWTPDGQIVFVSTYGQPFFRNYRAFTLDPSGGVPSLLPLGQVNHLSFGPGKARVIGRNTADPARWKRYRGGTAGHLWIDAVGKGTFRRMTGLAGNVTSPMWIAGRVYFLSDAEGIGNLYSCRPDGSDVTRHTDHDDFYARHAQTDGKRIVYQCGARVWLFDPVRESSECLDVRLPSHRTQASRRFVPAADYLEDIHAHPQGHSVAVVARGKLVSFPLWEGAVRQHGDDASGRYRLGQWLDDGVSLVAITDATGEEQVEVFEHGGSRVQSWDVGRVHAMRAAPRGRRVAIANHRNEVLIGDLLGGALTLVDRSEAGRTDDIAWSPDGAWLAYSFWTSARHTAIKLHDVAGNRSVLVTQPEFRDYAPAFDPDGRYLYFLSLRTFDPVYDSVQFELSFPRGARPYLIALQKGGIPPFEPVPKGLKPEPPSAERKPASANGAIPAIELDGIAQRIAAFPVVENRFGQIAGVADDKVIWTVLPIAGAHGRGGHKDSPGRLEVFDFATRRTEPLMEKADAFALAGDHATLIVRQGKRLRAISASHKPDPEHDAERNSDQPSRKSGWLDLDRIRLPRMAADVARSVEASARPVLGAGYVRRRLGERVPAIRALAGPRCDPRRALGPDLGNARRARHVARLRSRRRPSAAAAGGARLPRGGGEAFSRRRQLRDHAYRNRRRLGCRRRFTAQRGWRRGQGRRAHRCRQRPAHVEGPPAPIAARSSGRDDGRAQAGIGQRRLRHDA
jgi:tricorn protease